MKRFLVFFILSIVTSLLPLAIDQCFFDGKTILCFLSFLVIPLLFAIYYYKHTDTPHKLTGSVFIGSSFIIVFFALLIFNIYASIVLN